LGVLSQPGKAQPWSRRVRARRRPVGMVRVSRPMSRGWLAVPPTAGRTELSQARRRSCPGLSGIPSSRAPVPVALWRWSRGVRTTRWGRSPPLLGRPPWVRVRSQSSTRASAIRWGWVRSSRVRVVAVASGGPPGPGHGADSLSPASPVIPSVVVVVVVVGWGAARGSRAARITAASAAGRVNRPWTVPSRSGPRCSPRVARARRSARSRGVGEAGVGAVGVDDLPEVVRGPAQPVRVQDPGLVT